VTLKGKRKISDVKITAIDRGVGKSIRIETKKKQGQGKPRDYQDPGEAIAAVGRAGFEATGEPVESQSFQDLGRSAKADLREFHVEFDGAVGKIKPADLQRATHRLKQVTQARRAKISRKNTAGRDQFNMDVSSGSAETSWSPCHATAN
jgi:hypothetical protein